jgi:hypothetical protein
MRTLRPYLLLTALALLFFQDLVRHPDRILYSEHSDLPDLHIPAKRFLVRNVRETGELPLWDPHQLAGAPFVHDIQAGIFYPPHAVLYALPEERVGPALSWLVVLHVLLAGWGMYAYARTQGLAEVGALVAAVGFMFAGRWLLHLLAGGHYIVVGLAWLPLLLLLLERAIRQGGIGSATLAGVVYGVMILGTQPQWTFYATLFVATWTLAATLEGGRKALARWVLAGAWVVAVGVSLAAVQLLPTAEAAGLALRSGGLGASGALDGGLRSLLFLVGPALSAEPHNLAWEDRGGLTPLWLAAAVTAGLAASGRVRFQAGVALAFAVFAIGGSALLEGLPGFRLFRQPPRMFVILGFPTALLAGHATELLFAADPASEKVRLLARKVLGRLVVAVAILAGGFAVRSWLQDKPLCGHLYWFSLALTIPAAFVLLLRRGRVLGRAAAWVWAGLLLLDLWALTAPLVDTRPQEELLALPACVAPLAGGPLGQGRVLDVAATGDAFPLGCGAPLARIHRLEALRGYNPLDYRRYKQYLHFAGGGSGPLTSMNGPLAFPVLGNFPVVHKPLLDLLNTRYLLQPAAEAPPDGWVGPIVVDPSPRTYNFLGGGTPTLPPYALYENPAALPRAFVVFDGAPLGAEDELPRRLAETDFRRTVLLEGPLPSSTDKNQGVTRTVAVRRYEPNRVALTVGDGPAGWLLLTDLWYPGWVCEVAGRPTPVLRADYLFRAVGLPAGACEVEFAFRPEPYRLGRAISLGAAAAVACLLLVALAAGCSTSRHKGTVQ